MTVRVQMSRWFGVSIVLTIAGVPVAASGEGVRDGLGSESLRYDIASDNAAILNITLVNGSSLLDAIYTETHSSSEDRFFSIKILEEGLRVFRYVGGGITIQDRLKSSPHWILVWVLSSILVHFLKRVVLFAENIAIIILIIRSVFSECDLVKRTV